MILQERVVLTDVTYPTTDASLVFRFRDLEERNAFKSWWSRFGTQAFEIWYELEQRSKE